MEIIKNIHQIKIDFWVTENTKRFVYVYLITGQSCYLIDSGIKGSEKVISTYMEQIGRNIKEIKAIFITHSHPDHIGGAASIKKITNCTIYANIKTKKWSEDIDLQFKERPIPNFYRLVDQSIIIDKIISFDAITLESDITILPIYSPGHSDDSTSYLYQEKAIIFIGDTIPIKNDLPIIVDYQKSIYTLSLLDKLRNIAFYCPSWDRIYNQEEIENIIIIGKEILTTLYLVTQELDDRNIEINELSDLVCKKLNISGLAKNPLFQRSVLSCRKN